MINIINIVERIWIIIKCRKYLIVNIYRHVIETVEIIVCFFNYFVNMMFLINPWLFARGLNFHLKFSFLLPPPNNKRRRLKVSFSNVAPYIIIC